MVTESPEFEVSSDNVVFVVSDSVTVVVVALGAIGRKTTVSVTAGLVLPA
jgi:hypothetical protein